MPNENDDHSKYVMNEDGEMQYSGDNPPEAPQTQSHQSVSEYEQPTIPVGMKDVPAGDEAHQPKAPGKGKVPSPAVDNSGEPLTQPSGKLKSNYSAKPASDAETNLPRDSMNQKVEDKVTVGWLVITKGPGKGASFQLSAGVNKIGRLSTNDIALDFGDTTISKDSVCEVNYEYRNNEYFVVKGQTSTIPLINGKTLRTHSDLNNSDILTIGKTDLIFIPLCTEKFQWEWE